jgi:hypothetical protein
VAHRRRRGREEVTAVVPLARLLFIDQLKEGFMHQRGRLQCLPRFLLGQLLRRQLAKPLVNQRKQLLGGAWIAWFDGG